jgi:hypothetical protein
MPDISNFVLNDLNTSFSLFFKKEHLEVPLNQGEKRESLIILEKVGLYEGLIKKIVTDGQVCFTLLRLLTLFLDGNNRR